MKTVQERFDEKWIAVPETGCWLWKRACRTSVFQIDVDSIHTPSRASWIVHNGPLKPGQIVLRTCGVFGCVNPRHLCVGTRKDSMKRAYTARHNMTMTAAEKATDTINYLTHQLDLTRGELTEARHHLTRIRELIGPEEWEAICEADIAVKYWFDMNGRAR